MRNYTTTDYYNDMRYFYDDEDEIDISLPKPVINKWLMFIFIVISFFFGLIVGVAYKESELRPLPPEFIPNNQLR